ncbi:hypothetical protein EVAR_17504_1 [Eumeta japonica]|uniref:Uncharacterized protein n=1 Tax=Eumeta variegata TaxID=151549 RepID=A0A4C1WSX9_EUMVA|nr:hypothetical protein EVAR_17504_1 [Eumeta japonica]
MSFETGEVVDRLGCIKASEVHEVVVYEDRGSERIQQRTSKDKKAELEDSKQRAHKQNSESNKRIRAFLGALIIPAKSLPGAKYMQEASTSQVKRKKPTVPIDPKTAPTRAQKGEVDSLAPVPIRRLRDHYSNAFSESIALTSATLKVHKATCEGILRLCRDKSEAQSTTALENAETATNDNDSQAILRRKMSIIHMAAYSAINGLVGFDKEPTNRTERPKHIV